ncbi:hypothetical protein EDB85DRAFT_227019 [Lactarius pseudohatsudake]|nr:hypothetical protein EDB85DRAFT_227019 [Lactarius pseudohatsudake]
MNYPHTFSVGTDTTPSPSCRHSNKRQKREISQCGPYLGDRVIRLQRLLNLNSTSNMLRNRTNLEDLTETNATTIAPAPAPPPMAHIGKKFSLIHPLGHLPLAHPTLVFDLPLPRRLVLTVQSVGRRHFLSIVAERWGIRYFPHLHMMQQHHTSVPLWVYLWRLNGQLKTQHSQILDSIGV